MARGGLKVASLSRRLAAGVIDFVTLGIPFLALTVGGAWLYATYLQRRGRATAGLGRHKLPRRWQLALDVASVPVEVGTRNWRGPGYRILGLRQVNARTGGPVSIGSAFVSAAVKKTWIRSTRVLARHLDREHDNRADTIDAELEQARRAHAGDSEAMRRAAADVYRRHGLNPTRACLPALASATVLVLPALWSPLNQTLPERIAGTIVIRQD